MTSSPDGPPSSIPVTTSEHGAARRVPLEVLAGVGVPVALGVDGGDLGLGDVPDVAAFLSQALPPCGVGVLGVIYGVLIANPRKQVRESVDHLMHIKMVFLAYLRRLHQSDQAYTRRLLDDDPMTVDEVKEFSALVGAILHETALQNSNETGSAKAD